MSSSLDLLHHSEHYTLVLLVPFALIVIGGLFVMADVVLLKRRGDADGARSFLGAGTRPRAGLQLASIFFFTLASVLATRDLLILLKDAPAMILSLAIGITVTVLAFLILLFGILLSRALGESLHDSLPIRAISKVAHWLTIWADPLAGLGWVAVAMVLRIFRLDRRRTAEEREEDVLQMMDEGLESGAFDAAEMEMVEGVLDLDEQSVAELMTPRSRVTWLDLDDPDEVNWRKIAGAGHSDYPVFQANHDNVRGIVSIKSLWANISMTGTVNLADVLNQPLFVPVTMTAPRLIEEFRNTRRHVALVVDEFGVVEGMVTLQDVVEAIVGRLPERGVRQHYPEIITREDGSWLVDAQLDFEETAAAIGLSIPSEELEANRYQTIGGYVLHHLGHIPEEGERFKQDGYRFEIVDMDRQRIDKLLVTHLKTHAPETSQSERH
ncbi:MAG: hemolysin family protein [Chthoniobacterales bacterium]